jgi:uncharacterized repeat protein (TIGR03803 family)
MGKHSGGRFGAVAVVTALMGMMLAAAIVAPAQTFTTLVNFNGNNGAYPLNMSLVQGTDGNLYGTTAGTFYAGVGNGYGTVFKVTPAGGLTTLHTFRHTEGADPVAGLALGTDENFYGTTAYGGASASCKFGCGTIFRITPAGVLTTTHSFDATDGAYPNAALIQASDGNFYGTAAFGGDSSSYCTAGCGTVFKITSEGTFTTVYRFRGGDGAQPMAALVEGSDGNLYGTTQYGGSGYGTVFKISPNGALTIMHSFAGYPIDGAYPEAALLQAADGDFYGTTMQGGPYNGPLNEACENPGYGCGTIFKITPAGTLAAVYNFCPTLCGDGAFPVAPVIRATDGNLYGTTDVGGNSYSGTVFGLAPGERLTTLHSFDYYNDGANPDGGLVQATDGSFYGTTSTGVQDAPGTLFRVSVGLGPFVTTLPTSRIVGQRVAILGNDLTGATKVTFNGTAATFTVVSSTEISTIIPSGATTGPVQVVTPSGTLTSNVNFQVLP